MLLDHVVFRGNTLTRRFRGLQIGHSSGVLRIVKGVECFEL